MDEQIKKDLEKVKQNPYYLRCVKEQTLEMCLVAVQKDWRALQFVKNQTPEICMEAVRQDWRAFEYVENKEQYWG